MRGTPLPSPDNLESQAWPAEAESATGSARNPTELMEIQRDLAVALLSATNMRECLDLLLTAAIRLMDFDSGAIYLRDEASGVLDLIARTGLSEDFVARVASYLRDSESGRTVEAGAMELCLLRGEAPPPMAEMLASEGLEAIVMVPLRKKGRMIACLNVCSRRRSRVDSLMRMGLQSLVAVGEVSIAAMDFRENLRRGERLSHLAVEGAKLGIWERDLLTDGLFLDSRSRSFFGYSEDEPLVFQDCLARIHPDDRDAMMADIERAIHPGGGSEWKCEIRIIHPDQGIRWILGTGQIERDANGRAVRITGINMDITERKQMERPLLDSEEKYRKLHESMTDAYCSVDMDGRIFDCNQAYLDLTGYSREELSRLTYRDITPEKWHAFEARIVNEQVFPLGSSETYEKEYLCKDGTVMPVELRTFLIRDAAGNPSRMWAIVRDITERKTSETMMRRWNESLEKLVAGRTSELRRSQARLQQLAEATFEGIAICENGIMLDGNSQIAAMHGYDLAEMIGRPVLDFIAPESREMMLEKILARDPGPNEFVAMRADGTTFTAESHTNTAIQQGAEIRVVALRDLTNAKAAAARILAQQTELEEVQRLALVSEIATGIIHQVGQPLSSMGANLVTAINCLESCTHAACQSIQVMREVENDISRMREIVIHLRSLGDPNRMERKACDLNQIIKDLIPLLRPGALSGGIDLNFVFDVNLPLISANPVQLSQVVLNLAKNAFEACAGQIPERRIVSIRSHVVGKDWVEISVRDTGGGISPEVQDHLFRPFFSTKADGLGVGLRLCRTIMEAHGGTITGSNGKDGLGATFRMRLPIIREAD